MNETGIYLYGMTLITTSHRLEGEFPGSDSYCEIAETCRSPGGETGTCAIVLASLGFAVQLDGNFQGYNTFPELASFFQATTVSLDLVTCDAEFEGLEDIVFVDGDSRTSFGRFGSFYADKSRRRWNAPHEESIRQAGAVGLDPFFFEESVAAARLCKKHGVKFVTVDCPLDSEVHVLSAVNVLSEEFLRRTYPDKKLELLFEEYTQQTDGLVIFTFGRHALWYGRNGQGRNRFTPYKVDAKSTLGAGDCFKAGAIYAVAAGMRDADAGSLCVCDSRGRVHELPDCQSSTGFRQNFRYGG